MKILITGSSGMLGSDLVDILSRRHEVVTSGSLDIRDL
ncbi:MAG TPA: sugar nucleotide-binding protein, partial [Methanothermobacter thermautotrophicus]|nr:sugar nucleotide-binding protein [Methanothermobacter thermautotrophicus]